MIGERLLFWLHAKLFVISPDSLCGLACQSVTSLRFADNWENQSPSRDPISQKKGLIPWDIHDRIKKLGKDSPLFNKVLFEKGGLLYSGFRGSRPRARCQLNCVEDHQRSQIKKPLMLFAYWWYRIDEWARTYHITDTLGYASREILKYSEQRAVHEEGFSKVGPQTSNDRPEDVTCHTTIYACLR